MIKSKNCRVYDFTICYKYVFKARKPVMPSSLFVKQYFASFSDDVTLSPLTEDLKALAPSRWDEFVAFLCLFK